MEESSELKQNKMTTGTIIMSFHHSNLPNLIPFIITMDAEIMVKPTTCASNLGDKTKQNSGIINSTLLEHRCQHKVSTTKLITKDGNSICLYFRL